MSPTDQAMLDEYQLERERKARLKQWVAEEAARIREQRARLEDLAEDLELYKPKESK